MDYNALYTGIVQWSFILGFVTVIIWLVYPKLNIIEELDEDDERF